MLFGTLGMGAGLIPGFTIGGLAVLPGDDSIVERVMRALCGFGSIFGVLTLSRAIPLIKPFFDNSSPCTDYLHADASCWVSASQAGFYVFNALLLFKSVVHRIYVDLYTKRNIGGRLDLCWQIWASYLIKSASSKGLLLLLPYCANPDGRAFLTSLLGVFEVLVAIETALLGLFSSAKSRYTGVQTWLARLGTVSDSMAIAALMSSHGNASPEKVVASAKSKLRCTTLSAMDRSDFVTADGRSHDKFSKSVHCQPGDVDVFISHSWRDSPVEKWEMLNSFCNDFFRAHNREAKLWVDLYCLDPDSASEPQYHPVYLMSSERLLVLKGPTFTSRLWYVARLVMVVEACRWGVCHVYGTLLPRHEQRPYPFHAARCMMEIFMFVEAGGAATSIDIIPFAGCSLSMDGDWDTSSCESPKSEFQFSMLEVIRACGSISKFNARVLNILRNGDSYHQETQLIDKCNQGKKAAKAFDFQRRLPALIGGGGCTLVGACARSYVFRCCNVRHFRPQCR